MTITTHELKISFTQGRELAQWAFDDCCGEKCCKVKEGDKIHFRFDGAGDVGECVVLCGQMQDGLPSSPFAEGNRIDLKKNSTVTVRDQKGLWGFSIAFTARNADATTSFYYVPDPEVEVSSQPGSGQLA
jgi:hypothetical protein